MSGFILESKSILDSDIWSKPPLYFKVWHYLLLKAQYEDSGNLKRGQLFTNINEIRDACSYYVGYRKVTPSRQDIHRILDWMRSLHEGYTNGTPKVPMIETTKVTHGMIVTIVNYAVYQDFKFYERDSERNGERTTKDTRERREGSDINKEYKEKEEKKKEYILSENPTPYSQITELFQSSCHSFPKIRSLNNQRKAHIRNLLKTYTVDDFQTVFEKAEASDFLSGRTGKWNGCGFDWLIKPGNFLKVLEGNYDNKGSKSIDSLKRWAEGDENGQETDSNVIDVSSIFVS